MKNERISNNIKISGFLMSCFIVFYHVGGVGEISPVNSCDKCFNDFATYIFDYMGHYAMCHFFAITGFLLFYDLTINNYKIKMYRRFFSLFIPYLAWQVIITIKSIITSQYHFSTIDFLTRTFCLAKRPIDGPLWYVYVIFLLAIISPVFLLLMRNKMVGTFFTIFVCLLLEVLDSLEPKFWLYILHYSHNITSTVFYLPAYLIGAFCGHLFSEENNIEIIKFFFVLCFVSFLFEGLFEGFFFWTIVRILPLAGILLIPSIPRLNNLWIYKVSFFMYATHGPLIEDVKPVIEGLFARMLLPITVVNIFLHMIILACDIILSILIYLVISRVSSKAIVILTGGRGVS